MSQQIILSRALRFLRGGSQGGAASPIVTIQAKNNSGGALVLGDVVVMDWANCTKDLLVIKTTTSSNDVTVAGMVLGPLAAGAIGEIQIWGPTSALKADGTTDIAIGDALGTFTTAKIAAKSTTGGRFARALEAYTTNDSAGVIDAFISNLDLGAYTTE